MIKLSTFIRFRFPKFTQLIVIVLFMPNEFNSIVYLRMGTDGKVILEKSGVGIFNLNE